MGYYFLLLGDTLFYDFKTLYNIVLIGQVNTLNDNIIKTYLCIIIYHMPYA